MSMPRLVAAPDKFKGTASAAEVAAAVGRAAATVGWQATLVPVSDGGEGLLEAVGGDVRVTRVTGPDGRPVDAEWCLLRGSPSTGVVEMARAAGLTLAGGARGNDPERATTAGVGQLVAAAVAAGAERVVVGCGGSATTDGGRGAVEALGPDAVAGVELVVACDVSTAFLDAARVFGPQKGARPDQVARLAGRLAQTAADYRERFGVDVTSLAGAGAAGGLAGGLAALGGRLVPGFELVADLVGLPGALEPLPDLVVTGEGRLDGPSLEGKVVGGVLDLVAGRCPVLVVAGQADPAVARRLAAERPGTTVAVLAEAVGLAEAMAGVGRAVEQAVVRALAARPPVT